MTAWQMTRWIVRDAYFATMVPRWRWWLWPREAREVDEAIRKIALRVVFEKAARS